MKTKYTVKAVKAIQVEQAYYDAARENISSEGCYSHAVSTARALGGVEIDNSNDGNGGKSFAPSIEFEFDDASSVMVTYGGVFA